LLTAAFQAQRSGNSGQRLIEVGYDIFGVFDAQREPDEIVLDANRSPFPGAQVVLAYIRGQLHQACGAAQAWPQ